MRLLLILIPFLALAQLPKYPMPAGASTGGNVGGGTNLTTADRVVIVSGVGLVTESSALTTSTVVLGASALTTAGAIPVVSGTPGTLAESFASIAGSPVTMTLYDSTAVTGDSVFQIRNGAAGAARLKFGNGGTYDLALSRTSAGKLQINSGTAGNWGVLDTGGISMKSLATPGAVTVTPTCVPGVCNLTWTYTVEALLADGTLTTVPGAAGSTALQNGTLDANNYNTLTCAAVTGATSYRFRRTVSGGTPATLGVIGTASTCALVDNGLAGDGSAAPTVNTTGSLLWATDSAGDIGASGASRPGNIYAVGTIASAYGNFNNYVATGGYVAIGSGAPQVRVRSGGNSVFQIEAETAPLRLAFGGSTSSFPAIKRSGPAQQTRLADDSAFGHIHTAYAIWMNGVEGGCATAANLVVDAALNTKVTSASYNFVADDVGGRVQVISGAGWTPGDYTIVSVAANAATLDRSPAAVGTTGGTFTVNRGRVVLTEGALGAAADTFRVCTADAAGAMAYRALY